ncbi:MAG: hypothetical protein OCC46_17075, partial [Pseudodesulfovibrio sp.]
VKEHFVRSLKEQPAVRQEGQATDFAHPRQHLFATFFIVVFSVVPTQRQEEETRRFARPRQHLFATFFSSLSMLTIRYI